MVKKYILVFFLAGCSSYNEYHGHYGVDAAKMKKQVSLQDIQKIGGDPLVFPLIDGVCYYIGAGYNLQALGSSSLNNATFIRVAYAGDSVLSVYDSSFCNPPVLGIYTKREHVSRNVIKEAFSNVGKIRGPDSIQK
jgi:hypothetical protein